MRLVAFLVLFVIVKSDCPDNDQFPCGRLCWCVPGCGGKDYCPQIGQSCVDGNFRDCQGGCVMPSDRTPTCGGVASSPPYPDYPAGPPEPRPPLGLPESPPRTTPPPSTSQPPPSAGTLTTPASTEVAAPASSTPWWKTLSAKIGAGVGCGVLLLLCCVACALPARTNEVQPQNVGAKVVIRSKHPYTL